MNPSNMLLTPVTYALIAICVVCFIPVASDAFIGQNPWALFLPENPQFNSWQYLSSMFMHGSVMHLLFNMLGLWMFGLALERLWGSTRFLVFYLCCGIGGGLIYTWVNEYQFTALAEQFTQLGLGPTELERILSEGTYPKISGLTNELVSNYYQLYHIPAVGASGAIYGILAAFAVCFPNHKLMLIFLPYPIAAKYFVPVLLLIDLFSGVTGFSIFGSNIAHFAHVGGAVVGFVLVFLFKRQGRSL